MDISPTTLPALADRAQRYDGWTPDRQRAFLEAIAEGHTVGSACRLVGMAPSSAYALRRRAAGAGFALDWRAANLLAREKVGDTLLARAIDGQVETITRPLAEEPEPDEQGCDDAGGNAADAADRASCDAAAPDATPPGAACAPDRPPDGGARAPSAFRSDAAASIPVGARDGPPPAAMS